jgi:hypothetical protein
MSTRTIIEINHDQLAFLLAERQQVFPILLETLRAGEAPCWVGRSFIQGDGIRILAQRHHSEPEWHQSDVDLIAQAQEFIEAHSVMKQSPRMARALKLLRQFVLAVQREPKPDQEPRQAEPAERIARLKTALQFYADVSDYKAPFTGGMGKLWHDCGATAREAISFSEGAME